MATESRGNPPSLKDLLFERPGRFEFFQAVRLLRMLEPDRAGVGRDPDPEHEVVRFRSDVSLSFPVRDVAAIEQGEQPGGPPELSVAFLGIATPASFGSLPDAYAKAVLDQGKRSPLRDFFDIFNHRLVSLFYRSYEKYQLAISHEAGEDDFFERALRGVLGIATPGLEHRLPFDDAALFARAGLLALAPVSAPVLESILESYFEVPVRVEQFIPTWFAIADEDLSRLGTANATLGGDLTLGRTVRLSQFHFRIRLGPMGWDQYREFLPGGGAFDPVFEWVRLCLSSEQSFEIQLVLQAAAVPPLELSGGRNPDGRLGFSSWIGGDSAGPDRADAFFRSEEVAEAMEPADPTRDTTGPLEMEAFA